MSEELSRMRAFFREVNQAIDSISQLDEQTYQKIKAMSEADVDAFIDTLDRKKQSHARVIIDFIRRSSDLQICRATLLMSSFR